MIVFPTILGPDGNRLVQQRLTHPAVYLDTWAVRLFAEDEPVLGDRFRNALLRSGGTLVLSHINVGEFTYDGARHARRAGQYIAELGLQLFFSMFDPFRVIIAEIPVMVRQTTESPAGDPELTSPGSGWRWLNHFSTALWRFEIGSTVSPNSRNPH
jgi:hypothetical protein